MKPGLWSAQRFKSAALAAGVALPPLIVFANACGQIHGRVCGMFQMLALLLVIPPLVVSSFLAPSDASNRTFWIAFVGLNVLILGAVTYFGLYLFAVLRRSSGER